MSLFRASNAPNAHVDGTNHWQVPAPRQAYADPYDGPTERLFEAAAEREPEPEPQAEPQPEPQPGPATRPAARESHRGGIAFAVSISMVALVAALGAGLIAWRALGIASATPTADASHKAADSPVPVMVQPSAPGPEASAEPYVVSYAEEPLRVQVGCASVMYLDLDEPRANAGQQASDLRYDSPCGKAAPTLTLAAGAQAASQVTSADTDAAGCDKAIRTSPLGLGAGVPAAKGTVLCVLTSTADADSRGDSPRMVLLEVTDVTADGTAAMKATSWTVP